MRRSLLAVTVFLVAACGAVPRDEPPDPIAVRGEADSGQSAPTWLWEAPPAATEQRVRLIALAGSETEIATAAVAGTATRWTSTVPLEAGAYRFEVTARDAEGRWFAAGAFTTTVARHGAGV